MVRIKKVGKMVKTLIHIRATRVYGIVVIGGHIISGFALIRTKPLELRVYIKKYSKTRKNRREGPNN